MALHDVNDVNTLVTDVDICTLQQQLDLMQQKFDKLEAIHDELESKHTELESKHTEARMRLVSLETSQHNSLGYGQELQRENEELQRVIETGSFEIEKLYSDVCAAKHENTTLRDDYRNILNHTALLSERLKDRENDNKTMTERNTKLELEIHALKHMLLHREDVIGQLSEKEDDYTTVVNEMKHQIHNLNEMLNDKNEEIHHLVNKERVTIHQPLTHLMSCEDTTNAYDRAIENDESIVHQIQMGELSSTRLTAPDESTPLLVHRNIVKPSQKIKYCICCSVRIRLWPFW
eukprot:44446_1